MAIFVRASVFLVPFVLLASDTPAATIGKPAPPLTLKQLGADSATSWQNLQGAPVVLEFWATWCAPCVSSIPHLNGLATKFQNVRFISLTDERPDLVRKFLVDHPIEGTVAYDDDGKTHAAFGVSSYPHTALIDAKGVLRAVVYPSQLNELALQQLVDGKGIDVPPPAGTQCTAVFGTPLSQSRSGGPGSIEAGPGRWRARDLPLQAILAAVYSMPEANIVVPDAIAALRYNISVRITPPGGDALRVVRQRVEHALKTHRENRTTGEFLIVDSLAAK